MINNISTYMLKLLFSILLGISGITIVNAQSTNTEELIIHIDHFNFEKQMGDLSHHLYNFKGTNLVGYCKSLDVLMFRINRNLQEKDDKMFEVLKSAGYLFQIKENASIEKVQAACTDKNETPAIPQK